MFTKLLTNGFLVRLKFPKVAMNLAILLRSCQSSTELGNEVANFHAELRWEVKKFIAREVRAILCN